MPTPSPPADLRSSAPTRRLGPLGAPNFALFATGYTLSVTGSAMVAVALSFAVFRLGGGAGQVSAVLAAESLPTVLLLLIGGVIADRLPRRTVMLAADLLRGASEATLAALLFTGHASVASMMATAALIGVGEAFFMPGRSGLVPQLVEPALLQSANAVLSVANSLGGIVGPAVGGLLVGAAGPGWAFAVDATSYAVSAACLLLIRVPARAATPSESLVRQLATGWREFRSRLWLWLVVAQFALVHLVAFGPLLVLGPLRYRHVAGGATLWGSLLGAFGAGALLGGLLAMRFRPRHPLRAALLLFLLFGAAPAMLAWPAPFLLRIAAFVAGGLGIAIFGVLWNTTMQREIPPDMLSRVSAYDMVGSICLLPAGYLLAPPMAAGLGVGGALWLAASFTVVSTLAVLVPRGVRGLRSGGP